MKVKDIIKLYEGLDKLSQEGIKFSAKTGYFLAKNKITLEPLYQAAIKARQGIWLKYGVPEANGDIRIPTEKINDANKEMADLMETENDIILYGIRLEDLGDNSFDFSLIEGILSIIEEE